jgi:hypothetical protein
MVMVRLNRRSQHDKLHHEVIDEPYASLTDDKKTRGKIPRLRLGMTIPVISNKVRDPSPVLLSNKARRTRRKYLMSVFMFHVRENSQVGQNAFLAQSTS